MQGLEQGRVKGLCPENVAPLYDNLHDMYSRHNYSNTHVWNCDESGPQIGWNGSGHMLSKKGIWSMHTRENGFMSSFASMHRALAFPIFIRLRVRHPTPGCEFFQTI